MNERQQIVFKNGIIIPYAVKKKNPHQDSKQKGKETFASSFYAYGACHISV